MTDVWKMPAIAPWEKNCGKHPTQKPLALAVRAILSCTAVHEAVLDPFAGSGTTGIAANLAGRRFIGIEKENSFLEIAERRRKLMETSRLDWSRRIADLNALALLKENMIESRPWHRQNK